MDKGYAYMLIYNAISRAFDYGAFAPSTCFMELLAKEIVRIIERRNEVFICRTKE